MSHTFYMILFQWQWSILPGKAIWWMGAEGYRDQTGHPTLAAPLGRCCHQTKPCQVRAVHECLGRGRAGLQQGWHDAPSQGSQEWKPGIIQQNLRRGHDSLPQASPDQILCQTNYPWGWGLYEYCFLFIIMIFHVFSCIHDKYEWILQETAAAIESIISEFKGSAGLDIDGIHLFKSTEAVDAHWATASKHLCCMQVDSTNTAIFIYLFQNKQLAIFALQDPPGIQLYVSVKVVVLNGVRLNKYKCRRGSNSLEGLHSHLYNAIPSQRCGIMPFQVSSKIIYYDHWKVSIDNTQGFQNNVPFLFCI